MQTCVKDKEIEIIRSDRKTIAIEIKQDMRIIVRAPGWMKKADIQKFIDEKTPWIEKHLGVLRERNALRSESSDTTPISAKEIRELGALALEKLPPKVEAFSRAIGVTYGRVTVRNQVSRWGSCSSKGNLNFNCLLMLCPDEVVDYVIIHELCHRKHMDHSKEFWAMVEKYCPDYKKHRIWLKENGSLLIRRLRSNG